MERASRASTAGVRIAILADIHGNHLALEAVLEDAAHRRVDRLIVAGDIVVGSPDSLRCWERVKALGCPVLRGNHERYVFDLNTPRGRPEWLTEQFGPVQYAARQLGQTALAELAALPTLLRFPETPDLLFCHGSARSDNDLVFPYSEDADLEPMFAGYAEPWLIRGHNHFSSVRLWGERNVVTVGSVGLPLDGTPRAQYTILEQKSSSWRVEHRAVVYDVAAAARRFADTGYLHEGGPMARLYQREVVTAAFHILPFLAFYEAAKVSNPKLSLSAAVYRYVGDIE